MKKCIRCGRMFDCEDHCTTPICEDCEAEIDGTRESKKMTLAEERANK